jgi:hypothetical protein
MARVLHFPIGMAYKMLLFILQAVAFLDSNSDLDFKDWLMRRTDVQSQEHSSNYCNWFSDSIMQGRLRPLSSRLGKSKTEQEKKEALLEGQSAMVLYSTLIYYLYPSNPSMRKEIDSNPRLKKNFLRLKGWFDSNGGQSIASEYYQKAVKQMGGREPW